MSIGQYQVTEEQVLAEICRDSFVEFVREFWDYVSGTQSLIWNWHMEVICKTLEEIAERVFNNTPRKEDIVLNISPGTSKPVWEEMPVLMGDGTYKSLRDIVVGDMVIGKSGRSCRVSAVHVQGELPCVKISTAGGRDIVAARDHPILTADGWVEAGDIVPGQMLALMHRPDIKASTDRTDDEFRLAGYFIGDGSVTSNNCNLTSKDPEYIDDFRDCVNRMGYDCRVSVAKNGVTILSPIARLGKTMLECPECKKEFSPTTNSFARCCSRKCTVAWSNGYRSGGRDWVEPARTHNCRQWLRGVGIWSKSSKTKDIPDFVWLGTDDQIAIFLAAYFQCDGHVSWKDSGKRNITVSMCTISEKLARGLQRLFLRLGISMRLRRNVAKNGYSYNPDLKDYVYYTVATTDQDATSRFMERIPLIGRKLDKLREFFPRRRTFAQQFWPDKVDTVDGVEKLPCRCLTVEGDSSFVVDGVVVHNSTLCSILFPCWAWTRMPHARILTASHTDSLVLDLATKSRDVIRSEKYKKCFPEVVINEVQDAKGYYRNTLGGDRFTCTVGGKTPMGFHGHLLIIDDPLDPKRMLSEAEVLAAKNFMTNVLPTRKVDKLVSVTFLVMQRLGVGDPTGVMLEESKKEGAIPVRHICLPSDLVKGADGNWIESDVSPMELANRYVNGLMDPCRLPESVLREYKARGVHFYETQFRQKPFSKEGGLFEEQYFNLRCKSAPYDSKRVRFWDRACVVKGSWTCILRGSIEDILSGNGREMSVLIEEVREGDYVLTKGISEEHKKVWARVIWAGQTGKDEEIATAIFESGSILFATKEHLVWSYTRNDWVRIWDLKRGEDVPCCQDGAILDMGKYPTPYTKVCDVFLRRFDPMIDVYDLEVEHLHEFFANGILVHNSTQDGGCYTAGVLLAKSKDGHWFVEHVEHGQWEPRRRNEKMRAVALRDRTKYGQYEPVIVVEREGGSAGRDAWLGIVKALEGFYVVEETVTGKKDTRAEPWSSQLASGNVSIVEDGSWDIQGYIDEHVRFKPDINSRRLGSKKDMVDASSGAFNYLIGKREVGTLLTHVIKSDKKIPRRIVVCDCEQLSTLVVEEHPSLLLFLRDPKVDQEVMDELIKENRADSPKGDADSPLGHSLTRCMGKVQLEFLDIHPKDYQDCWEEPMNPWKKLPRDLTMTLEHGKRLWGHLLKKRDLHWELLVIVDDVRSRAISVARAISYVLRLPKDRSIWTPGEDYDPNSETPNSHIFDTVRLARSLVVD